jgi:hypothetical protein
MITNDTIDLTLTAIAETHDQIDALDSKATKKRADLQERLKLLKQLQSLDKQFKMFGAKGVARKKFRDDHADAHFHVWMNIDPERVAWARAFLAKHEPELLRKMDAEERDNDYQEKRMEVIRFMYAEAPDDVQNEMFRRFLVSVADVAGNLPAWLQRRLGPEMTAKLAGVLTEPAASDL